MAITRRTLIGSMATAGLLSTIPASRTLAQDATPVAVEDATPAPIEGDAAGYAIARLRELPTKELTDAIFPDVMANFLPATAAIPGFHGYVFAFHETDPSTSISLTLVSDESAAATANEIAMNYVAQLDPRFVAETPFAGQGRVRMYALTERPSTDLPPFLHGAYFTMRDQTNPPDFDVEGAIAIATETLIPLFGGLPGFIHYCWFEQEGGRVAINIWESEADAATGDEALLAWREEYFDAPTSSETVTTIGTVGYAEIVGLT